MSKKMPKLDWTWMKILTLQEGMARPLLLYLDQHPALQKEELILKTVWESAREKQNGQNWKLYEMNKSTCKSNQIFDNIPHYGLSSRTWCHLQ